MYDHTQFFLSSHGLHCLPLQASVSSTLCLGLGFETCFGQWNVSRSDGSRGLGCACAVGLVLTVMLWPWEEMAQIAQTPEKNVDQSLLGSLIAWILKAEHPSNAQKKWMLAAVCIGMICYIVFHGKRCLIQMPVLQIFFSVSIYYSPSWDHIILFHNFST